MIRHKIIFSFILLFSCLSLFSQDNNTMFSIQFLDSPPYKRGFLFFSENQFRIQIKITNLTDSVYLFEKLTFSGANDGNPRFYIKSLQNGRIIYPYYGIFCDYLWGDSFFIELKPNQTYLDTLDLERYGDFKFKRNETYEIWFEYEARYQDYKFDDKTKSNDMIFKKKLVSNKLRFKF